MNVTIAKGSTGNVAYTVDFTPGNVAGIAGK